MPAAIRHVAVAASSAGDITASQRLLSEFKTWLETPDSAGGYMVSASRLPGYLPALSAAAPLRARCRNFQVSSNEVHLLVEGDSVTVDYVAEAGTKPDSTGTVDVKVSTIHKVAGVSSVSDELLDDSAGLASELVSQQFARAIGQAVDLAILDGSGIGEPTGILHTAGIRAPRPTARRGSS